MTKLSPGVEKSRKEIVETIIQDIEKGTPLFWDNKMFACLKMVNATTNKPYRGINRLRLFFASKFHEKTTGKPYSDNRWMTFKQIKDKGYHLKQGAKGMIVEYYDYQKIDINEYLKFLKDNFASKQRIQNVEELIKEGYTTVKIPFAKGYVVFNGDDIEGIPARQDKMRKVEKTIQQMENMIKNSEAKIVHVTPIEDPIHGRFSNNYKPLLDKIELAVPEKFKDQMSYYATAAHEIAHSTGHQDRLNREGITKTEGLDNELNDLYAKEELRAELTSMFIGSEYGFEVDQEHINNHKAYLQSWAKALQNNPDELWKAATDAEKAVEYIQTHMINPCKEIIIFKEIRPLLNKLSDEKIFEKKEQIQLEIISTYNNIIHKYTESPKEQYRLISNGESNIEKRFYTKVTINDKVFEADEKGHFGYCFTEIKKAAAEPKEIENYKTKKAKLVPKLHTETKHNTLQR